MGKIKQKLNLKTAHIFKAILFFGSYFFAAKLGLSLEPVGGFATLVWPPTGIAIAGLLILGFRFWPAVLAAAFLVNFIEGAPYGVAAAIATGNMLEAVTASYILTRLKFAKLNSLRDLAGFLLLAIPAGVFISATTGTLSLVFGGVASSSLVGSVWKAWVFGDVLGALIFTPLIVAWYSWITSSVKPNFGLVRIIESLVFILLITIFSLMGFEDLWLASLSFFDISPIVIPYLIFLTLICLSLRMGQRVSLLGVIVSMVVMVSATAAGYHNAALLPENLPLGEALLRLQTFFGILTLTILLFSTILDEKREKEKEKEAKEIALELQTSQALARIGSWEWNLNTNSMKWSAELFRIRGFEPYSFTPTREDWLSQIHPDEKQMVIEAIDASINSHRPFDLYYKILKPDGTVRMLHASGDTFFDRRSKVTKVVGVAQDITEVQQNQTDLKRRTEELQKALTEIERVNNEKDRFLAVLSHELRNPLAPIISSIELIQEASPEDKNFQFAIDTIHHQSRVIKRLIDDLLDISRISHGKIQLRKEVVDIRLIVNSIVESSRRLIESRKHDLKVLLPQKPLLVNVDPIRLEQILVNLLTNAAKYSSPRGQIRLSVENNKTDLIIRVKDKGVGIAPEMLEKIFTWFEQGEDPIYGGQGGLGIGLKLVKNLTELHGGTVVAHSAGTGQGSEFVVTFPLKEISPDSTELSGDVNKLMYAVPQSPHLSYQLNGKKVNHKGVSQDILIVDDNQDAANSLCTLLNFLGYKSRVMYSGKEALKTLTKNTPDALLLDIEMPDMNGYEVVKKTRTELGLKKLPIIAITGYGQDNDKQRALDAGFDYYLVKPVRITEVQGLLDKIISSHRSHISA